jgi:DNA-binding NtrC family response regulator
VSTLPLNISLKGERARAGPGYGAIGLDCSPVATGAEKLVVLVVDDEPAIRLLCRVNLELAGYEVREAGSIGDARRLIEEGVGLVLLDMHIGVERAESLLEELVLRRIPVAVVTGSTEIEAVAAKGADAVLAKPFTIEDLEATVRRLAELSASRL